MFYNKLFQGNLTDVKWRDNFLQAMPFWIASIIAGLAAVVYARLFAVAEQFVTAYTAYANWSIFIVSPLCFIGAYLLVQFLAPFSRGSGIPQVMAAIHISSAKYTPVVDKLLGIRVILVKVLSSMLMVLGGAAIGREGPTIQIASSIFRVIRQWVPESWPKLSEKTYIVTGAAAGLAAAFNTPLGGIVFAIEELATMHISAIRTALFSAVIIAGLTAQMLLGSYLYLGYPIVKNASPAIFVGVAAVAIIAGFLGASMSGLIIRLISFKQRLFAKFNLVYIMLIAGITSFAFLFIGANALGSGKELMNHLLFEHKSITWAEVLYRIIGPMLSFSIGGAGGIFAPSLAAGASVGGIIAQLVGFVNADANILILGGMVGFLTGVTRSPFTSAILVLEMTDRHNVIFHLMLSSLLAYLIALLVSKKSFYEILKEQYLTQVLPPHHKP